MCQIWHGKESQPTIFPPHGERLKVHRVLPPYSLSQTIPQVKKKRYLRRPVIQSDDDAIVILRDKQSRPLQIDLSKGRQNLGAPRLGN